MKHGSHRTFKDITRITREHDALDVGRRKSPP